MGSMGRFRHGAFTMALFFAAVAALTLVDSTVAMAAITFSAPRQVTMTPGTYEDLAPSAWSPDGTRLLFSGEDGGGVSLFLGIAGADGQSYHVMRDWPSSDEPLAWSPDGQLFSFATGWNGNQIMYMGSDPYSGPLETIVRTQGNSWGSLNMYGGQWMPDGQSIVYGDYADGWMNVMVAPVDGSSQPRSIVPAYSPPSLSPDGSRVAYVGYDHRAWVQGTAAGPPSSVSIPLSLPGWMSETTPPQWSADGSTLAWVDWDPADPMGPLGSKRVWVASADGSVQRALGKFSEADNGISDMQGVSLSRDGSYAAFTALNLSTSARNLFVMSTDGGVPVFLSEVPALFSTPQWSPTSDTIAFESNDGDLWAVDVSGLPDEAPGPAPTLTLSHEPNSTGWYPHTNCPTVTIDAPEGHTAWYRWNEEVWLPATGPIETMVGVSTLYYCLDDPGNAETLRSKVFLIDGQPPFLDSGWRDRITVDGRESMTITDVNIEDMGGSGFDRVELIADGSIVATSTDPNATLVWDGFEPGVFYDLELRAYDGSGLHASQWSGFGVPRVPIATAFVMPEPTMYGWHHGMPYLELRPDSDDPGGFLYYRWDGAGQWSEYVGVVEPPATDGLHTLEFYQEDFYGQNATQSVDLPIDWTPPAVPSVNASGTSTSEIRVDISGATDSPSGLDFVEVWDGSNQLASLGAGVDTFWHEGLQEDAEYTYRVRAMDRAGHYSAFSGPITARTLSSAPPRVPIGTSVHVDLDDVILDFDNVIGAGDVAISQVGAQHDPAPNFRLLPDLYYDIHPTAVFSGNVAVTLRIPVGTEVDFDQIRLFHWEDGAWQDITTSVDPIGRTITGSTTSFSEFSVQEAEATPVVSTPASAPWAVVLCVVMAGALILRKRHVL